ncbi:MAG: amidohydrolase [Tannerellaceae bacterium]|nr:amidohydrolase [Tannerellaceae bacterium]
MDILIKNILFPDMTVRDMAISGKYIAEVGVDLSFPADTVIDGTGKAVIPGLVNGHTHAAMTLFRGFGDDMPLMRWLKEKIWPYEAKLTEEDIYHGSRLACLEMIKSGTTLFNDMYYHPEVTARVVEEMGLRACLGSSCFDHFNPDLMESCKRENELFFGREKKYSDRIGFNIAPHAIYTVSGGFLKWIHDFSAERNLPVHIHVAETEGEVADSIRDFGCTPVRYLHKLGVLSPRMIMAHVVYVDEEEIRMLADHEVKVIHNPASNMKLASGIEFKFMEMQAAGVTVGLGTDGCSSSNNLDMVEAMKLAALLGKGWRKDPEATPAPDVFRAATENGAKALGIPAGRMEPGYLADLAIVNLAAPAFVPNYHLVSNLVYAANGSCVETVICDGKILMEQGKVPGEEEILEQAARIAYDLMKR